jgi:4a-hydroxytetrahydrobiopterin dehydratase
MATMATMATLASMNCVPCRGGEPQVTDAELAEYRQQVPEWQVIEVDGERRVQRVFRFDDFGHALAFTNTVGELAEAEGHHPAILTEWGRVTVTWWTHAIGGLHRNDFVMAAKTDEAYTAAEGRK